MSILLLLLIASYLLGVLVNRERKLNANIVHLLRILEACLLSLVLSRVCVYLSHSNFARSLYPPTHPSIHGPPSLVSTPDGMDDMVLAAPLRNCSTLGVVGGKASSLSLSDARWSISALFVQPRAGNARGEREGRRVAVDLFFRQIRHCSFCFAPDFPLDVSVRGSAQTSLVCGAWRLAGQTFGAKQTSCRRPLCGFDARCTL